MARRLIRATPTLAEIETNLRLQEQVDLEIAHVFAAPELRLQQFDRAANHAALQFHKTSIEGDAAARPRQDHGHLRQ
jgi:hypothetical protein